MLLPRQAFALNKAQKRCQKKHIEPHFDKSVSVWSIRSVQMDSGGALQADQAPVLHQ